MLIYIILFLIILCNIYRFDIQKRFSGKQRIQQYHFCALLLIIVSSLSYRVGIDSTRYEEAFGYFPTLAGFKISDLQYFKNEPFWVLLNVVVKTIFNSWVVVKFIVMISFTMSVFYLIRHTTRYIFSTVLLFYFISWLPFCFETLRQTMALSFLLWGILPLYEGNFAKYVKRAWPMVLFHSSGIVLFLLIPCFKLLKPTKAICFFILILFGLSAVFTDYMYYIANIVNLVSAETAEEVERSLSNATYGLKSQNIVGFFVHGVQYVFPSVLLAYYYGKKGNHIVSNLLLLFGIFSIFSYSWIICYRFGDYVRIFYYVALCEFVLEKRTKSKGGVTKWVCCVGITLLLYVQADKLFNSNISDKTSLDVRYFPYYSILTKQKDPYREQYISGQNQFTTLYE